MSTSTVATRPTIAVFKFSSCDGCQLSLLDCEDELLGVVGAVQISEFKELTRAVVEGPYDVSFVEGSITTPDDVERIKAIRQASSLLVTIGASATSGGIQALRNYADVGDFTTAVYAHPEYISTLAQSTGIADQVRVDFRAPRMPDRPLPASRSHHSDAQRPQAGHPRSHRLPAVQGAGHGLRDGRTRHALSRPGDQGRLWSTLPGGRPRLLRMFRTVRLGEHVVARQAAQRAGHVTGRCVTVVPDLQRRCAGLS